VIIDEGDAGLKSDMTLWHLRLFDGSGKAFAHLQKHEGALIIVRIQSKRKNDDQIGRIVRVEALAQSATSKVLILPYPPSRHPVELRQAPAHDTKENLPPARKQAPGVAASNA
jgi:hypothetical protein